jgi:diguanylate cyclase (GGDEF)-like protein
LVVDDDASIRHLLTAMLASEYEVLAAESAAQAREFLARREVDIVLSDQYLAGTDTGAESGIQLLEWIRASQPATVRIVMTARASLHDAIEAINRGQVHRFLIKPLEAQFLLHTLRNAARTLLLERSHEQLLEELRRLNQELEQRVQQRTSQLEEANRQLQYKNSILERMALTDPLTGLPNRRAMDRLVRAELQRRNRHPAGVSLGVIDVDFFKNVNTLYLLPGGDHVLVWLAQTLSNSLRTIDTVGRIGGEEFMVLAPGTGIDGAAPLAERIRRCVADGHTDYNGSKIQITVSIGMAVAEKGITSTYEDLKQLASTALGEAKDNGRNCTVIKAVGQEAPSVK